MLEQSLIKGMLLKRLLFLVGTVAAMLLVAAPAFAPAFAQSSDPEATITGVIEPAAPTQEGPTHTITEASTGDVYGLFSDSEGVDLSQYEGLSVIINGIFQTQGNPLSSFDDPTDVPIYVTSVELLDVGPGPEEVSATGVLKDGLPADVLGDGTHSITDEATNTLYALRSAGADLDAYVDQPVTVYGALTPGEDLPNSNGIANSTLPSIDVTRIEPQEPADGDGPDTVADTVQVTFRLTLEGAIPENQIFGVDYPVEGQQPADVPLCTTDPAIVGPAGPLCEDGGVYEGVVEVPAGEPVEFAFQRFISGTGGVVESFYADTQTFTEDAVVEASYSYSSKEEPGQPSTGAEDSAPGNSPTTGDLPDGSISDQYGSTSDQYIDGVGTNPSTGGPSAGGSSSDTGSSADGSSAGPAAGVVSLLPDTGGLSLVALGLGLLLLGGGLLGYKFIR